MKWIEIIVVRSMDNQHQPAIRELVNQYVQNIGTNGVTGSTLYCNAFVETDLAIHIQWEIEEAEPSKSDQGIELAAALEVFGRIHHTIWVAG
jgi:hypothetical protein